MSVPHKVSQVNVSSILDQCIIRQQEQARDDEQRFERIMKIFYTLSKRSDDFSAEYFRRQKIGQDITQQERDQHTAENRPILEPLWHIDKELGGNLIAINSPIAWFNQKYQIHIHAANPIWNNLMELYTVEILSGHLDEHDFEEYRKNLCLGWK